uniref:Uncharacterized protein n=1 Tax=Plectus sambesii TaxID=2011161 RepID=A0A914X7A4_9BILA
TYQPMVGPDSIIDSIKEKVVAVQWYTIDRVPQAISLWLEIWSDVDIFAIRDDQVQVAPVSFAFRKGFSRLREVDEAVIRMLPAFERISRRYSPPYPAAVLTPPVQVTIVTMARLTTAFIVTEFANQFQEMKLRNQQLQSSLDLAEDEAKKNQDTVKKLLDDIERTRKYISGTDIIKDERDAAIRNQDRLQEELKKMEERMERSREAWESAQHELRQHQMKVGELDSTLRQKDLHTQAANTEFRAFKETLATLLSENYSLLPPTEDAIKERIRHLMMNKQDINRVTNQLDDKVKELSGQLEEQAKLHKNAVGRARKAEETVDRLHHQLKGTEGELTATDILKEGLQGEKFKYQRFLEQMAEVMKLESVAKDLGVALNGESLLARAEQLVRFEEEMVGKRNTQLNNTHRQLKDAKRELETKDTHLDLLRKKLLTLESDASIKAERDWEEVVEDNKKLARQVEKLSKQLHDNKQTVHAMKSESAENKSLKMTVEEQRRLLRDMERKLKEFDDLRERQARKIATLHSVKNQTEADASHGLKVTESTIQSLSNELQRLKLRTEELQKREKQLVDLRTVIARMLGLDISTLAVPDYEIISRLEKLIEGAHESVLEWNKMPAGRQANGLRAGNVDASNHYKRAYVMGAESQRRRDTSRTRPATSAGGRWK